jgi:gliding motility-associated-like protein
LLSAPFFATANDTCFLDSGINTAANPYSYKVLLFTRGNTTTPFGATKGSSTVFLGADPTDKGVSLSWQENTAWDNFRYVIERQNSSGGFDSIGVTNAGSFQDINLLNGRQYCYRIKAFGTYGIPDLPSPLVNFSQIVCAVPQDDVPPCPPKLTIDNLCNRPADCATAVETVNTLTWSDPSAECPASSDVAGYRIYYAARPGEKLAPISNINGAGNRTFQHRPQAGLAGCYAVTAFDFLGNESPIGDTLCVDNCPAYQLPNAFTPNEDGTNDRFTPTQACFIAEIDFKVFNRWGQLVFQTKDPAINWDGRNLNGQLLPDGAYYYVCRIFEQRLEGAREFNAPLSGYIQLISGN